MRNERLLFTDATVSPETTENAFSLVFLSFKGASYGGADRCVYMTNVTPLAYGEIVGDTNRLSCEPRGIPRKGLQIACVVTIYVNDIICKLA